MTSEDVLDILQAAKVDTAYYSIGIERHEALCLTQEGREFHVFLSEQGRRHEESVFVAEDSACVFFLRRLFQLWPSR